MTDKALKTHSTFRMACAIETTIQAKPEAVWALLTNAHGFAQWNSTVSSLEGTIAEGQALQIRVPGQKRVFKVKVSQVAPNHSMVWSDGMAPMFRGVRTFTLTPQSNGATHFAMREEFAGLMVPMIKPSLPDFAPVFEAYAADLKRAAESAKA